MPRFLLILALISILVLGITASLLVYNASQRVARSNHDLIEQALGDLDAIAGFRSTLAEQERLAYELYARIDADRFGPSLTRHSQLVERRLDALARRDSLGDEVMALRDRWKPIPPLVDRLIANIARADQRQTDWDAARSQLRSISDHRRRIDPILDRLARSAGERVERSEARNRQELEAMSSLVTGYTILILLIALIVAWMLHRLFAAAEANRALAQFPARNPMPVLTVDLAGCVRYANQAARDFVARSVSGGTDVAELIPEPISREFRKALCDRSFGKIDGELGSRSLAYHWYWLPDRQLFHVYLRDVTAERSAVRQLKRMAFEDSVTGLMNRNGIVREMQSLLQVSARVCLCLVAIDRFHLLPSSVGFDAADRILASFADALQRCVRTALPHGALIARLEGARFALCWRFAPGSAEQPALAGLTDALPRTIRSGRVSFHASYCMGVKMLSHDSEADIETAFSDADAALRAAEKKPGCGYIVHGPAIREQEQSLLGIEQRLRRVLADDGIGLELHFQPKIDLRDRAIVGAEALLRWNDTDLGPVPPDRFIPIAEQSGLIVPLGQWVIDRATAVLADWHELPELTGLTLAINAGAAELETEAYASRILDRLADHGTPAQRLQVEVTERVMADTGHPRCLDNLGRLHRAGVGVSLDDFGTGYSSLAYLSTMPISQIKIDKGFVDGLPPPPERADLARVIVNLARELDVECVAEGVEQAVQAEHLGRIGCHRAQGYYFHSPMPRADFEALLAD